MSVLSILGLISGYWYVQSAARIAQKNGAGFKGKTEITSLCGVAVGTPRSSLLASPPASSAAGKRPSIIWLRLGHYPPLRLGGCVILAPGGFATPHFRQDERASHERVPQLRQTQNGSPGLPLYLPLLSGSGSELPPALPLPGSGQAAPRRPSTPRAGAATAFPPGSGNHCVAVASLDGLHFTATRLGACLDSFGGGADAFRLRSCFAPLGGGAAAAVGAPAAVGAAAVAGIASRSTSGIIE
mmetsp:Transcript_3893/g.13313  ORF Transcript_3893/g.13313 Transcript_3893/m.13313 type:complete len:242 (+) Transcript_3893:1794-2519(+)